MRITMRIKRLRADGGFTALEVMLAVVLLAVGTTATAGLLLVATGQGTYSRQVSDAATLAEQTEEQYRDMNFASMTDSCGVGVQTTPAPVVGNTTYTVTTNVCLATPAANMNQITITVQWGNKDNNHTYQTQTILTALQ